MDLDPATRTELKRRAHHLKPVVQTGAAGLTDAVLAEIDRALHDHELIKLKLAGQDRAARQAMLERICSELEAAPVQTIGHTATVYRPRPEEDEQR